MKRDKKPQSLKEQLRLSFHTVTDMVGRDIEKRRQAFTAAEHFSVENNSFKHRGTHTYIKNVKRHINLSLGSNEGYKSTLLP